MSQNVDLNKSTLKHKRNKAHIQKNNFLKVLTLMMAGFAAIIGVAIVAYIMISGSVPFLNGSVNIFYFLFGTTYYPSEGLYAAGFMLINTIWVSALAIMVALPVAVFTAILITKSKVQWISKTLHTTTSVLAAIPSIIYGVFGSFVINGLITLIFGVGGGTVLAVVLTLAVMIIPTMTVVIINSINSLNKDIEYGSFALGATQNQTNARVTLRAIKGGITAGAMLGIGRAIGEATAVSLVATAGFTGPTLNLFEPIRLLTATMLQGFGELTASELEIRFSMGILLIIAIIVVFATVRVINYRMSDSYKQSKLSKSYATEERIMWLEKEIGFENMTLVEQNTFKRYSLIKTFRLENLATIDKFEINEVKRSEVYRKKDTRRVGALTYTFAISGLVVLLAILVFLFWKGLPNLNFHFLSSQYSDLDFTIYADRTTYTGGTFSDPGAIDPESFYYYFTNWGFGVQQEILSDGTSVLWIVNVDQNSPILNALLISDVSDTNAGTLANAEVWTFSDKDPILFGNVININDQMYPIDANNEALWDQINNAEKFALSLVYRNHGIIGSIWTTILLVVLTLIIAIPFGIMIAVYFSEYAGKSRFVSFLKTMIDLLAGIPSLLFGLVGSAVLLAFIPADYVVIAAAMLMAIILLPTVVLTTEESLNNMPAYYKHASIGLGASNARTVWKIKLPYIMNQVVSSSILLIGRVVGETAALVMILGFMPNDSLTFANSTTLATQIWGSMQGEVADYGTACAISIVILFLIFMLFISAQHVSNKRRNSATIVGAMLAAFILSLTAASYLLYIVSIIAIVGWFIFEIVNSICKKANYKLDIRYRWEMYIKQKKIEKNKIEQISETELEKIEKGKNG